MRACVRARACACLRVPARVPVRARERARACARAYVHASRVCVYVCVRVMCERAPACALDSSRARFNISRFEIACGVNKNDVYNHATSEGRASTGQKLTTRQMI